MAMGAQCGVRSQFSVLVMFLSFVISQAGVVVPNQTSTFFFTLLDVAFSLQLAVKDLFCQVILRVL